MLRNKTFAPEFCSLISNWFDMREQAPGANLLHESVSRASSLVCTEICLPWHDVSPVLANQIGLFFSTTTHCELTFIVLVPQSGCFIIQLPRRVLHVYWLGHLPGSMFRERVSGVCFRSKLPRVYQPLRAEGEWCTVVDMIRHRWVCCTLLMKKN